MAISSSSEIMTELLALVFFEGDADCLLVLFRFFLRVLASVSVLERVSELEMAAAFPKKKIENTYQIKDKAKLGMVSLSPGLSAELLSELVSFLGGRDAIRMLLVTESSGSNCSLRKTN